MPLYCGTFKAAKYWHFLISIACHMQHDNRSALVRLSTTSSHMPSMTERTRAVHVILITFVVTAGKQVILCSQP